MIDNCEVMEVKEYYGKLVIHGIIFELVGKDMLREMGQTDSPQPIKSLKSDSGYKLGHLNVQDRKIHERELRYGLGQTESKPFWLPAELLKVSGEISDEWLRIINSKSRVKQLGVVVIDRKTSERLNGKLPKVEFLGLSYQLDLAKGKLTYPGDDSRDVQLPAMAAQPGISNQFYLYQASLGALHPINTPILFRPEPLIVVEFPAPVLIDPVGAALAENKVPATYLNNYAQYDFIKLKTYSPNDLDLPERIKKQIEFAVRFEKQDRAVAYVKKQGQETLKKGRGI